MLPPRANPELLGQDPAQAALRAGLSGPRPHHAWLLAGPRGIGKATLAYRAARWLLSDFSAADDTPHGPVFRRVAAGGHPDLRVIERAVDDKRNRLRAEIGVDDIREATRFLHRTASGAGWRIVIIDGVEYLNRNAANALLKSLEEPPARAVLLLVCQAPQRLLPTVRSRCRTLRLDPLPRAVVSDLLARARPDLPPEVRTRIAELAPDSIGEALAYAAEWETGIVEHLQALLAGDRAPRRLLPDLATRSDAGFETFFTAGERLACAHVAARVRDGQAGEATARWIDIVGRLRDIRTDADRYHLERRQAVISAIHLLSGP